MISSNRVSSAPYITGDTFRSYADFVIDELNIPFFPEKVTPGSTIFVKTDYLAHFFDKLRPWIQASYILITHNSDLSIPGDFMYMLDDPLLIAWFGQNVENFSHPKLHALPIGLANKHWPHGDTSLIDHINTTLEVIPKSIVLYMNFSANSSYQERNFVFQHFSNQSFCSFSSSKDFHSYLMDVARSQFVLSPRGNGLDCHRTWEALYMGAIPIVKSSELDPVFEGLPVLIIDDWTQITYPFLIKKYEELGKQPHQWEKTQSTYWIKLIDSYRTSFQSQILLDK